MGLGEIIDGWSGSLSSIGDTLNAIGNSMSPTAKAITSIAGGALAFSGAKSMVTGNKPIGTGAFTNTLNKYSNGNDFDDNANKKPSGAFGGDGSLNELIKINETIVARLEDQSKYLKQIYGVVSGDQRMSDTNIRKLAAQNNRVSLAMMSTTQGRLIAAKMQTDMALTYKGMMTDFQKALASTGTSMLQLAMSNALKNIPFLGTKLSGNRNAMIAEMSQAKSEFTREVALTITHVIPDRLKNINDSIDRGIKTLVNESVEISKVILNMNNCLGTTLNRIFYTLTDMFENTHKNFNAFGLRLNSSLNDLGKNICKCIYDALNKTVSQVVWSMNESTDRIENSINNLGRTLNISIDNIGKLLSRIVGSAYISNQWSSKYSKYSEYESKNFKESNYKNSKWTAMGNIALTPDQKKRRAAIEVAQMAWFKRATDKQEIRKKEEVQNRRDLTVTSILENVIGVKSLMKSFQNGLYGFFRSAMKYTLMFQMFAGTTKSIYGAVNSYIGGGGGGGDGKGGFLKSILKPVMDIVSSVVGAIKNFFTTGMGAEFLSTVGSGISSAIKSIIPFVLDNIAYPFITRVFDLVSTYMMTRAFIVSTTGVIGGILGVAGGGLVRLATSIGNLLAPAVGKIVAAVTSQIGQLALGVATMAFSGIFLYNRFSSYWESLKEYLPKTEEGGSALSSGGITKWVLYKVGSWITYTWDLFTGTIAQIWDGIKEVGVSGIWDLLTGNVTLADLARDKQVKAIEQARKAKETTEAVSTSNSLAGIKENTETLAEALDRGFDKTITWLKKSTGYGKDVAEAVSPKYQAFKGTLNGMFTSIFGWALGKEKGAAYLAKRTKGDVDSYQGARANVLKYDQMLKDPNLSDSSRADIMVEYTKALNEMQYRESSLSMFNKQALAAIVKTDQQLEEERQKNAKAIGSEVGKALSDNPKAVGTDSVAGSLLDMKKRIADTNIHTISIGSTLTSMWNAMHNQPSVPPKNTEEQLIKASGTVLAPQSTRALSFAKSFKAPIDVRQGVASSQNEQAYAHLDNEGKRVLGSNFAKTIDNPRLSAQLELNRMKMLTEFGNMDSNDPKRASLNEDLTTFDTFMEHRKRLTDSVVGGKLVGSVAGNEDALNAYIKDIGEMNKITGGIALKNIDKKYVDSQDIGKTLRDFDMLKLSPFFEAKNTTYDDIFNTIIKTRYVSPVLELDDQFINPSNSRYSGIMRSKLHEAASIVEFFNTIYNNLIDFGDFHAIDKDNYTKLGLYGTKGELMKNEIVPEILKVMTHKKIPSFNELMTSEKWNEDLIDIYTRASLLGNTNALASGTSEVIARDTPGLGYFLKQLLIGEFSTIFPKLAVYAGLAQTAGDAISSSSLTDLWSVCSNALPGAGLAAGSSLSGMASGMAQYIPRLAEMGRNGSTEGLNMLGRLVSSSSGLQSFISFIGGPYTRQAIALAFATARVLNKKAKINEHIQDIANLKNRIISSKKDSLGKLSDEALNGVVIEEFAKMGDPIDIAMRATMNAEGGRNFDISSDGTVTMRNSDKGGPTNMGVTLNTYRSYFGKDKTAKDLMNMDQSAAKNIFMDYLRGCEADRFISVAPQLVPLFADASFQHGPVGFQSVASRAYNMLGITGYNPKGKKGASQPALNYLANKGDQNKLADTLLSSRLYRLFNDSNTGKFKKGMVNRVKKIASAMLQIRGGGKWAPSGFPFGADANLAMGASIGMTSEEVAKYMASNSQTSSSSSPFVGNSPVIAEAQKYINFSNGSLTKDNYFGFLNTNPVLMANLISYAKAFKEIYGRKITVNSGYRSMAHQAALYKNRGRNPNTVGKPSMNSIHYLGLAYDVSTRDMDDNLLNQHGLHRPYRQGDPVHIELLKGKGLGNSAQYNAFGYKHANNTKIRSNFDKYKNENMINNEFIANNNPILMSSLAGLVTNSGSTGSYAPGSTYEPTAIGSSFTSSGSGSKFDMLGQIWADQDKDGFTKFFSSIGVLLGMDVPGVGSSGSGNALPSEYIAPSTATSKINGAGGAVAPIIDIMKQSEGKSVSPTPILDEASKIRSSSIMNMIPSSSGSSSLPWQNSSISTAPSYLLNNTQSGDPVGPNISNAQPQTPFRNFLGGTLSTFETDLMKINNAIAHNQILKGQYGRSAQSQESKELKDLLAQAAQLMVATTNNISNMAQTMIPTIINSVSNTNAPSIMNSSNSSTNSSSGGDSQGGANNIRQISSAGGDMGLAALYS